MPDGLTAQLITIANTHGAAGVGVTAADPFARELSALQADVATKRSGPLHFTYDNPETATDVKVSFPWAHRLVAIAWGYLPDSHSPASTGPVIARFAATDHYRPLREITNAVANSLHDRGFQAEVLIDDNRLVDRAAAVRAGVGWWGKSTMVLAPGHGPWMLLGSVVTDAPLEVTEPMRRDCGTCVACIPACPTGAIDEHGLDARKCLSTWLQTPGSLPHWIRPLLGRRIYGCDDCLTSCPPGQKALATAGDPPRELDFDALLALSDEQLLHRFSWWYVPRRDGRFIRRNLLVAAGNSAEQETRHAITTHLTHPSSMIRGHASWALARGFGAQTRETLQQAFDMETVSDAQDEMTVALLMLDDPATYQDQLVTSP
jgi:epoxyqueuosine reductase